MFINVGAQFRALAVSGLLAFAMTTIVLSYAAYIALDARGLFFPLMLVAHSLAFSWLRQDARAAYEDACKRGWVEEVSHEHPVMGRVTVVRVRCGSPVSWLVRLHIDNMGPR